MDLASIVLFLIACLFLFMLGGSLLGLVALASNKDDTPVAFRFAALVLSVIFNATLLAACWWLGHGGVQ